MMDRPCPYCAGAGWRTDQLPRGPAEPRPCVLCNRPAWYEFMAEQGRSRAGLTLERLERQVKPLPPLAHTPRMPYAD